MRTRRGFTLIELLVAIVVMTIVLGGIYNLLVNTQRVSRGQAERVDMQANMRAGTLIVPSELREIGYDTTFAPATVGSDLLEMAPNRIRFRAVRGSGIVCAVGANTLTISLTRNVSGYRGPRQDDMVTVFVDQNVALSSDDRWITRAQSAAPAAVTCPVGGFWAGAAVQVTLGSFTSGADVVVPADITVGSPARLTEVMEYSFYTDAAGQNWLGAESISGGGGRQPVLGPLAANGFRLDYIDAANNLIACGAPCSLADRRRVRAVRVAVAALSDAPATMSGYGPQQLMTDSVVTLVALRNAIPR